MRIIGGTAGGRRFTPPGNMPHTRPTTDVAKEGLFNVIENNLEIDTLKALDLFGGTGSISYELASRGCTDITTVEKDSKMHAFILGNAASLGFRQIKVVKMDVFAFIQQTKETFSFIFGGPPYALTNIDDLPGAVFNHQLLTPKGWFVLEHTPRNDYSEFPFYRTTRKYGTTLFSIFVNSNPE